LDGVTFTQNSYQLVAVTGDSSGVGFQVQLIDVTPAASDASGQIEQEFVNLITSVPSIADLASAVTLGPFQLISSNTVGNTFTCNSVVSFANTAILTQTINDTETTSTLSLTSTGSCCGATTLASLSQSTFSGSCGKRVTLLLGRAYQWTVPTCQTQLTSNGAICSPNNATSTIGLGGLSFTGDSFFETAPVDPFVSISFDIPSCSCPTPSPPAACSDPCTSSILTAITGTSGSVTGTVSGLAGSISAVANSVGGVAGAVSGVASSVNNVITRLTRLNSTLLSVKNLDNDIKDLVKKRC